jgi:hypothetical protein
MSDTQVLSMWCYTSWPPHSFNIKNHRALVFYIEHHIWSSAQTYEIGVDLGRQSELCFQRNMTLSIMCLQPDGKCLTSELIFFFFSKNQKASCGGGIERWLSHWEYHCSPRLSFQNSRQLPIILNSPSRKSDVPFWLPGAWQSCCTHV